MSDDMEIRPPPTPPAKAIWRLVLAHACLGIALGVMAGKLDAPVFFAFLMAALFAQAGLLGFLVSLGTQSLRVRILEFAAGLAYLAIPSYTVEYDWWEEWSIFASCGILVAAAHTFTRRKGIRIRVPCAGEAVAESRFVRFGIRHLIVFTLAAAVLLRAGQFFEREIARSQLLRLIFVYGSSYALPAWIVPWIGLGGGRPSRLRSAAFVLAAGLLGLAAPLFQHRDSADRLLYYVGAMALNALILLASLAVLRRSGLRLMPGEKTPAADEA